MFHLRLCVERVGRYRVAVRPHGGSFYRTGPEYLLHIITDTTIFVILLDRIGPDHHFHVDCIEPDCHYHVDRIRPDVYIFSPHFVFPAFLTCAACVFNFIGFLYCFFPRLRENGPPASSSEGSRGVGFEVRWTFYVWFVFTDRFLAKSSMFCFLPCAGMCVWV